MSNKTYELDGFRVWMTKDWQKWYDIARSYKRASMILLNAEIPDRDWYSERDVLPLLSMLRHYGELVMKCLLVRSGAQPSGSHDLGSLKRRLDKVYPELFSTDVWSFLEFLNSVDLPGSAFRYPVDKSNRQFFTDANGRHTVDLAYLIPVTRQMFDDVTRFLDQEETDSSSISESVVVRRGAICSTSGAVVPVTKTIGRMRYRPNCDHFEPSSGCD